MTGKDIMNKHAAHDESQELWDLYDREQRYLGTHRRGVPLPEGAYHHTVCIFTMNSQNELLLTRRAEGKSFAGQWEVTAGSVLSGETVLQAAVRELAEETGIHCREEDLRCLDCFFSERASFWMTCFFLKKDVPEGGIRLQPGETSAYRWVRWHIDLLRDASIAEPVRVRLAMFFRELQSFTQLEEQRLKPWLDWAKELQSLAQQGIEYTKDPYDRERFERLSEIAREMVSLKTGISTEKLVGLFSNETGYQTPKVETRACVFRGRKILLVQERASRRWSMPGGWCDIGIGIGENCVKECREEAGLDVRAIRVLALENRSAHDYTPYPYEVLKCYVLCEELGGAFQENIETTDAQFFSLDELPPLSLDRITRRSVEQCFIMAQHPERQTLFD